MAFSLRHRGVLELEDYAPGDLHFLIELATELKRSKAVGNEHPQLKGKNLVSVSAQAGARPRCGLDVAVHDQGGHLSYIEATGSQVGPLESMKDTARVLGRLYSGIDCSGFPHSVVEEIAKVSRVPVWNGLGDTAHPSQILADLLTMREFGDVPLHQLTLCYLGDARTDICRSLLVGGVQMGMDLRIAAPETMQPPAELVSRMRRLAVTTGAHIGFEADPVRAVAGADFVYTDAWIPPGAPPATWRQRIDPLLPYQVTDELMRATANPRARFMHSLPAHHNLDTEIGRLVHEQYGLTALEVTDDVFESPASIVFTQAENRMHAIKAVLVATFS